MSQRTRSRTEPFVNGTWARFGSLSGGETRNSLIETCVDYLEDGDNHPLSITKVKKHGGIITTNGAPSYWDAYFDHYQCEALRNDPATLPLITSYPGELPDAAYAAKAAARTNPSRPYVDVPVNILELGDISRTLRSAGNTVYRQLGGNNLKYQFGIAPLVSDAVKLVHFQSAVERRMKELAKLRNQGLRRTVTLDQLEVEQTKAGLYLQTQGGVTLRADVKGIGKRTVKAHCRWSPASDFRDISDERMSKLARKAVLGLKADLSTAWEVVPWSWLIDWATNIGDILKANRNIIPATLESIRLMKHTQTDWHWPGKSFEGGYYSVSDVFVTRESKVRYPVTIIPTAHFPFLTGNQMGILASLAVVRR
jgi:hypothetical protein